MTITASRSGRRRARRFPLEAVKVVALGICAVCAQTLFVRELLSLFAGTELVIGVIIAAWLFWVGVGGAVGGRLTAAHRVSTNTLFTIAALATAALLPATVAAVRFGRGIIAFPPGELPDVGPALVFSVLVIAPFDLVYGFLYNAASELAAEETGPIDEGVSRVYVWEALGSLVGALLFSFVLMQRISQFRAACLVAFLVSFALIPGPGRRRGLIVRTAASALAAGLLFFAAPGIDRAGYEHVYRGYEVEEFSSSRYGEITVASVGGARSYFSGGGRLLTDPEPERAEETVHFPLLAHPGPRRVLLVGGALGGGWEEAAKHSCVEEIDCLELDGELLRLALAARGIEIRGGGAVVRAGDVSVRFMTDDGRFHLSRPGDAYDVIVLNAPAPVNLQWNRYFTREFFEIVRGRLAEGGIYAFSHPSSENFLSSLQAEVLRGIELTAREVFPRVDILPGSTAHFLAGSVPVRIGDLMTRLRERRLETSFVNEDYLPFTMTEERIGDLARRLEESGADWINIDSRPALVPREIMLEGMRTDSALLPLAGSVAGLPAWFAPLLLGAVIGVLGISARGRNVQRAGVWTVGCLGFIIQLCVMLSFQSFSGLLYHAIVVLTALFMGGASMGAWLSMRRGERGPAAVRSLHVMLALHAALLPVAHLLMRGLGAPYIAGAVVYFLFSAFGGLLTGYYYREAVASGIDANTPPATFYAIDLFGACVGGLVGGLVLFPVTGLYGTAVFAALMQLVASMVLPGRWSIGRPAGGVSGWGGSAVQR